MANLSEYLALNKDIWLLVYGENLLKWLIKPNSIACSETAFCNSVYLCLPFQWTAQYRNISRPTTRAENTSDVKTATWTQ